MGRNKEMVRNVTWIKVGETAVAVILTVVATVMLAYGQQGGDGQQGLDPAEFFSQGRFDKGQNIAPTYEGWQENPDGTFDLIFGYLNRNWKEQVDVPIGPDNSVEPGGPDQGQPTHFFPRRNRYIFHVRVPRDFGNKDIVWTLTVHGRTERAYGSLRPAYVLEPGMTTEANFGRVRSNEPPIIDVDGGESRTVKAGEPLRLNARVSDDGLPKPAPAPLPQPGREPSGAARGLRVSWYVYRGPAAKVSFEPTQIEIWSDREGNSPSRPGWVPPPVPEDKQYPVRVTFAEPGTYTIRILAHDGGQKAEASVAVTVIP